MWGQYRLHLKRADSGLSFFGLANDGYCDVADFHCPCLQLGIKDEIGDSSFDAGMLAGAQALGDQGATSSTGVFSPDWDPAFKNDIHGLIQVTGECHATVGEKLAEIKKLFRVGGYDALIYQVFQVVGDVRPGKEKAHEQLVYLLLSQSPRMAYRLLQFRLFGWYFAAGGSRRGQKSKSWSRDGEAGDCSLGPRRRQCHRPTPLGPGRELPRFPIPLPISAGIREIFERKPHPRSSSEKRQRAPRCPPRWALEEW